YKSQLAQQKEKYENKIKALKYDLEKKKELSFKRKLSKEELLELRKILARDYGILCIKEWEMSLFAEKIALESTKMTTWDAVVKKLKQSLDYWQNYDEYEEKWRKILRR
ncbi:phage antirepressor Ant, partial [Campylobacter coli]|nr:phage antirepressor Ant [Campylobacter coli]